MTRIRRWLRPSIATLCVFTLLSTLGGCRPSNEPAVQLLGEALRRQLPAPPPGQTCPATFDEEVLMTFLRTALALQNEDAHHQLLRLARHLECVSAARFAEIATAMDAVLQASEITSDEVQEALAPLVMLFADMSGPFRGPFALWLLERSPWLYERLEGGGVLSALGLPVSSGSTVELRSGLAAFDVLGAITAPGMLTGNCRVEELVPLVDPLLPGTPEQLFCPSDCNDAISRLGREIGEIQEALFPEMEEMCQQIQQERRDFSGTLVQDFGGCIDQFVSEPSGLMACVADSAIARRATALDIDTNPQRDFQIRRACALTNPGGMTVPTDPVQLAQFLAAYGGFRAAANRVGERGAYIEHLERAFEPVKAKLRGLEAQLDESAPGWDEYDVDPRKCPVCEDPDVQDALELWRETSGEAEQIEEYLTQARREQADAYRSAQNQWRQMEEIAEASGAEDCGPDGYGCSDQCGLQDQLMAEMNGCIEAEARSETPMLGSSGGDPINPWVARPNPNDPRSPNSVAAGFAACLRGEATLLGGGFVTQHHCSTTLRCANGEIPQGIDCDCLDEQNEQRLPESCDTDVMYCTNDMSCDCGGPLPEGFEGGLPSPIPGGDPF